jgi:hypothetical protein
MEKRNKIIYWIATALLSVVMLMSGVMYLMQGAMIKEEFLLLGYPAYIVYPLAIAKILGIIAIVTKKSNLLKELAYAGFFFDFLLATSAHLVAKDGEFFGALIAMLLLLISYIYDRKVFTQK